MPATLPATASDTHIFMQEGGPPEIGQEAAAVECSRFPHAQPPPVQRRQA